jgi:hypothetical protein
VQALAADPKATEGELIALIVRKVNNAREAQKAWVEFKAV